MTDKQLISLIEKIRGRNNKCWMDLMRLAFNSNPKEAKRIMAKIVKYDKAISKHLEKLSK